MRLVQDDVDVIAVTVGVVFVVVVVDVAIVVVVAVVGVTWVPHMVTPLKVEKVMLDGIGASYSVAYVSFNILPWVWTPL